MKAVVRAVILLIVVVAVAIGLMVYSIYGRGLSTKDQPTLAEEAVARSIRALTTSSTLRRTPNPVQPTAAVLDEALTHFADHCATCHANDGSGNTGIGRSFYPPAPDMRAARTQAMTDGELFAVIENGIRLTGMPAWGNGTPEGERDSWGLVHFIRRLATLTPEDIVRMEELNPTSRQQLREEEETRRFLSGDDPGPAQPPADHQGDHQ